MKVLQLLLAHSLALVALPAVRLRNKVIYGIMPLAKSYRIHHSMTVNGQV